MQLFIQAFCFIYLFSSCSYLPILEPIADDVIEVVIEDIIKSEEKSK